MKTILSENSPNVKKILLEDSSWYPSNYRYESIAREPNNICAHTGLASTYSLMGREKEARAEVAEVVRINPKFSLDFFAKTSALKDRSVIGNMISALRKAGLK